METQGEDRDKGRASGKKKNEERLPLLLLLEKMLGMLHVLLPFHSQADACFVCLSKLLAKSPSRVHLVLSLPLHDQLPAHVHIAYLKSKKKSQRLLSLRKDT